jgi:hypothetical protein
VIVIPVLVLVLAALTHFTQLYAAKFDALREARRTAWLHALSGCRTRAASTEPSAQSRDELRQLGRDADRRFDRYAAAAGGAEVGTAWSVARAAVSRRLAAAPWSGAGSVELAADFRLPCNEQPRDGDAASALRFGWEQIRFW